MKTNNDVLEQTIEYHPSFAGRIARIIIPLLQTTLPSTLYKNLYDILYSSYKKWLRIAYAIKVVPVRFWGSQEQKTMASLTLQLLPYTMGGSKALENAFEVTSLAERMRIKGALVECGVAEGGTAAMMALTNQHVGHQSRLKWFFDSYEGLPEPTEEDYQGGRTGHFVRPLPKGACLGTIEQVSELMFDKLGLPRREIHLIKGWFQDSIPAYRQEVGNIAVLRLDGDWYESTKIPLENFYDQISPGGFIIIDDYSTCYGSSRAVDEFRQERQITSPLHSDGRGGVWFQKPTGQ